MAVSLDNVSLTTNIVKVTRPYDSASKRAELLRAAKDLFYRRGYHRTSLADVAGQAGVPLGNVHYYFPTKQALAEAVVASHTASTDAAFSAWESHIDDPRQRLAALVRSPLDAADAVIQSGCPQGSLCQELEKMDSGVQRTALGSPMLERWVDWAARQFALLGWSDDESLARARQLVASIQGTMLLAHALHSADVLSEGLFRLETALAADLTAPRS